MTDWISVFDRLPAEYEDVLVYVKTKYREDEFQDVAQYHGKKFYKSEYMFLGNVTHWMLLPDTPKPHRKTK
jgi:hypothetical protein